MRRNFWNEIRVRIHAEIEETQSQRIVEVVTMFLERNRGQGLRTTEVIEILSHNPDIRILYLDYSFVKVADIFGWLNGIRLDKTPNLPSLQSLGMYNCSPPLQDQMDKILDFVAMRTEAPGAGSVVEKLQKLDIEWRWYLDQVSSKALEEQLTRMCKLYDIQYSNNCNAYQVVEDVHDRSQDSYMYLSDRDED